MSLKTDYVDDVLIDEKRKYKIVQNDDDTVSFTDVTEYAQVGDNIDASVINGICEAINNAGSGGGSITVDTYISSTSTNPVQNKVIKSELDSMKSTFQSGVDGIYNTISSQGTTPASKSLSDVKFGILNLSQNRYDDGLSDGITESKTEYEPKQSTLSDDGALIVKNAEGTSIHTNTFTNSYNAGVTATKKGTAVASDVRSSKTFTNSSSVGISGTMTEYTGSTTRKTFTPSSSSQTYTIPAGYHDGNGKVVCNAQSGITPSGTKSITSNGTYDVTSYASASVNVSSSDILDFKIAAKGNSTTSTALSYTFSINCTEAYIIISCSSGTESIVNTCLNGCSLTGATITKENKNVNYSNSKYFGVKYYYIKNYSGSITIKSGSVGSNNAATYIVLYK